MLINGKYIPYLKKSQIKEELFKDLKYFSNEMGILPTEIPHLATSVKEYSEYFGTDMSNMVDKNELGECRSKLGIIFVNINKHTIIRGHISVENKNKESSRYHNDPEFRKEWRLQVKKDGFITGKIRYSDHMETLVHELVHYRFPYLRHGDNFEKRVYDILVGNKTYSYRKNLPIHNCQQVAIGNRILKSRRERREERRKRKMEKEREEIKKKIATTR
jgi:hypothetical protein